MRTVPHPRTLVSPMCLSLDVDSQSTAATLVTENPRNCKPGPDAFGQEDKYTILPSPWFVCCLHRLCLHVLTFGTYGLHSFGGDGLFDSLDDILARYGIMTLSPCAPICFTVVKDRASEKGAGALILGKILPIGAASIALYGIFFTQSMEFAVIVIVWYVVSAILAGGFGKRVGSDILAS